MRQPSGHTHLLAVIGEPIDHVRAPEFYNPRIAERGLDAFLIPLHVPADHLESIVRALAACTNLKGLIVTIPHKETVARLCGELGPQASRVGAVNTVRIEPGGRLVGENFDGPGLLEGMRANSIGVRGQAVLLLGAGGAARAIAFSLADAGAARITIANRNRERAIELAGDLALAVPDLPVEVGRAEPDGHTILINATSLGLHDDDPRPVLFERLTAGITVVDIISVRETPLMQAAREQGLRVMGGRPMVDHQVDAQLDFFRLPATEA
jgi:shikimate dehydrogenase